MTEEEVKDIVSGAIEVTENNSYLTLPIARAKTAKWLWERFKIAIKGLVVSMDDGLPYLHVEYFDEDGNVAETHISMAKYSDKLFEESKKI